MKVRTARLKTSGCSQYVEWPASGTMTVSACFMCIANSRRTGGGAIGDAAAQWRAILTTIKSDLEELGSALEYLIKLTFFVRGPFPDGGVLSSPNFRLDVLDEFFAEHCPKHCSYNNPPPSEVIGVAALAQADIVIEIVAIAALPD